MKKIVTFLGLLVIVFLITGCGSNDKLYSASDKTKATWVKYELDGNTLVVTDVEGNTPAGKGSKWTYERDGNGNSVVGRWRCVSGENGGSCSSSFMVVDENYFYTID